MNWPWPYPGVWSWIPKDQTETPSSAPAATAHRPTPPAALRTPYHHKFQIMTTFPWLETKSLSSSSSRSRRRLTLTSPRQSPETVTSASPTDACSRPNGQPLQPACPAHSHHILDRGHTMGEPILPHQFTQQATLLHLLGNTPLLLQVMVQLSSPQESPQSAEPPPPSPAPVAQGLWGGAPFLFVLRSCL